MATWETVHEGNAVLDVLTDEAQGIRVTINRLGAEMVSLQRRDSTGRWQGFLYRDGDIRTPEKGWANHATVMGYFVARLWHEKSLYRGKEIKGGNHGFIRHFPFRPPVEADGSLVYTVPAASVPHDAYPLKVSMDLTYRLTDRGVIVEFSFSNHETDVDAHLGFGLHPGFAVSSIENAKVLLPEGVYTRLMAPGNFLDGQEEVLDHDGGELPYPKVNLPGSFILEFDNSSSRILEIEDKDAGRRIGLDFTEVPYVTIWSDMNPFVCVEPCWGLPDSNPPTAFENKPGAQVVASGHTLRRSFGIYPEFIS